MSRTDSPRVSCSSSVRSTIGWPPSSAIPASNDTRVRVEGFWKISATDRRFSTSELCGAALSSIARSISAYSSSRDSSSPVMKWRVKRSSVRWPAWRDWRLLTWNLFHGRAVPPAGPRAAARVHCGARAPGNGTRRCCRRCRRGGPPSWHRALDAECRMVLTSRNSVLPCAGRSRSPLARPDQVKRRRLRRDPRAALRRLDRRAPRPAPGVCGPSGAGCTASGCGGCGSATCTPRLTRASASSRASTVALVDELAADRPRRRLQRAVAGVGRVRVRRRARRRPRVRARARGPDASAEALEHGGLSDHAPLLAAVRRAERAAP